jgi:hypothetical protein
MHRIAVEKIPQISVISRIFRKLPKVNNRLRGENSPNLVTLPTTHSIVSCVATFFRRLPHCERHLVEFHIPNPQFLTYTNIFHCNTLQNLPSFYLTIYHLATQVLGVGNNLSIRTLSTILHSEIRKWTSQRITSLMVATKTIPFWTQSAKRAKHTIFIRFSFVPGS